MKASEILVGDRIKVTIKATSGDIVTREFDVAEVSPYDHIPYGDEGVVVKSVSKEFNLVIATPRDTVELVKRPLSSGRTLYCAVWSDSPYAERAWSTMKPHERERWERGARAMLDMRRDA